MTAYPALDFLRKVQVWQEAPGGTGGLALSGVIGRRDRELPPRRGVALLHRVGA